MNSHLIMISSLVILTILSAFFAASETAFSTVNKIRLKSYVKENNKSAKTALDLAEKFDETIFSTLIGITIVNIVSSTLSAVLMLELFGESGAVISSVIMAAVTITFAEIIPKSLANDHSEKFVLKTAKFLKAIIFVIYPLIFIFLKIKKLIIVFTKSKDERPSVTERELKHMIEDIQEEGVLEKEESEMVKCALEFDEKSVGNVLVPRVNMVTIEVNDSEEKIKNIILKERYSRIPVCKESADDIIGVLHTRDYLEALALGKDTSIEKIMKPCHFVYESKELSLVLNDFRQKKVHLAIVVDNYGGTLGMITMEDLLEEIVGEIWDEDEEAQEEIIRNSDGSFETSAEIDLKKILRTIGCDWETNYENHSTLGSFLIKTLNRMPEKDEEIKINDFKVTIQESDEKRIGKVIIQKTNNGNL